MNFSLLTFAKLLLEIAGARVTEEQAFGWLEGAIEKVEGDYQSVRQLCQSCGYDTESPAEITFGLGALEEYREALALVEDYYCEGDPDYLEEAARLAASAQLKMDAAQAENQRVSDSFGCDLFC